MAAAGCRRPGMLSTARCLHTEDATEQPQQQVKLAQPAHSISTVLALSCTASCRAAATSSSVVTCSKGQKRGGRRDAVAWNVMQFWGVNSSNASVFLDTRPSAPGSRGAAPRLPLACLEGAQVAADVHALRHLAPVPLLDAVVRPARMRKLLLLTHNSTRRGRPELTQHLQAGLGVHAGRPGCLICGC